MNIAELLALYDRHERVERLWPGARREATPQVIRHINAHESESFILYSFLDEETADEAIAAQVNFFESNGRSFEWKVFAHDRPPDLKERLIAHGFDVEEPEAIMVLELESAPDALLRPLGVDVRRVTELQDVNDVVSVQEKVWQRDYSWLGKQLREELEQSPNLSIYVAYVGGVAASAGWLRFSAQSPFASLWGGSTLVEHRGRGLYTALLGARVQEARRRDVPFLTIDAGPLSRPIVERYGFRALAYASACRWKAGRSQWESE